MSLQKINDLDKYKLFQPNMKHALFYAAHGEYGPYCSCQGELGVACEVLHHQPIPFVFHELIFQNIIEALWKILV